MSYTILRPKSHEAWLELRQTGIGSSDCGTIMGVNKYETPLELWMRRKGLLPAKEETLKMRMGHVLEPLVAQLYEEASGNKIQLDTEGDWCVRNNEKSFLLASPDRIATALSGEDVLLECKSTELDIDKNNPPMYWLCQVQYLLHVTELKKGALAWIKRKEEFDYIDMVYSPTFAESMVEKVERFWVDNIIGNQPPKCIRGTDISLRYDKTEKGKIVEATDDIRAAYDTLVSLNAQISSLIKQKDEIVDRMKLATADAEKLMFGDKVLASYTGGKDATKQTFNEDRFKAENAELYAKYIETINYVTQRSFRPKY